MDTKMEVLVESTRTLQVGKMLFERNIPYEVAVAECSAVTPVGTSRRGLSPVMTGRRGKSPIKRTIDWRDFYPLDAVYRFIESLEVLYPSTCTVIVIGKSVEGRDIKMLKISNSDARNTGVWLDGAIHAREWVSTAVVTFIAGQIARNFNSLGQCVTNKDWYFLPVVNPDGYHHSFTADRMWRKNRARSGNNVVGVDLNRNFSYRWGFHGPEMSSHDPNHINYRGTTPFSEPETTAIKTYASQTPHILSILGNSARRHDKNKTDTHRYVIRQPIELLGKPKKLYRKEDIILYSGTPFKIFLTFHAYSEVISFPWCYSPDPCPDYVDLLEGGTAMAKAIYETNGRMYKVGNFKDIMYYASGTSIDWSYGTARIPFSYLVELRSKKDKFMLPNTEIKDCCSEVYNGVLALVRFVDGKKCLNCSIFEAKVN